MDGLNETENEMEVEIQLEPGGKSTFEQLMVLLDQIDRRGYPVADLLLDKEVDALENNLILDSRNVFRAFYKHEYKAEQEFTRAFLQYYWGTLPNVISYLYDSQPD